MPGRQGFRSAFRDRAYDGSSGVEEESRVSVLVVMTVPGDTATFEAFVAANRDLVMELTEKAKAGGCRRHQFAIGDGEVLVVDEWETAEQFQTFISSPEIQEVLGQMGAQGEPRITIGDAKGFPGEF
jgi:hypothetical protein